MRRFIDSLLGFPRCRLPSRFESVAAPCARFRSKGGCLSLMGSSCWPSALGARLFALLNNPWSGPSTEKYSKISIFYI